MAEKKLQDVSEIKEKKSNLQDVSEIKENKKPTLQTCKRCEGKCTIPNPMYKNGQPCPECGGSGQARYLD